MACEECRELHTHQFRSQDDLVHALQVAAMEVDRGVLQRLSIPERTVAEGQALQSAIWAGALPEVVTYRFKCTVCGDEFTLNADIGQGQGEWRRDA